MFCEGVQSRLRFCLYHLSCVKMAASQFHLQSGKQRSRAVEGRQSYCFWQKIPWWKRSARRCIVMMQQPVLLWPKFPSEVFAHFHAVAVKRYSSVRNWLFGLPGRILCEQPLWCQRKWLHALDFAVHLFHYLSVCPEPSMIFKHACTANAFFLERLSNYC
jgi:hypothetical protein